MFRYDWYTKSGQPPAQVTNAEYNSSAKESAGVARKSRSDLNFDQSNAGGIITQISNDAGTTFNYSIYICIGKNILTGLAGAVLIWHWLQN